MQLAHGRTERNIKNVVNNRPRRILRIAKTESGIVRCFWVNTLRLRPKRETIDSPQHNQLICYFPRAMSEEDRPWDHG